MSKINTAISQQAFELIRNRIGEILITEVANQATLNSDPDINATVWIERYIPFDKTELPAINVSLARGGYDNKDSINADGTYNYMIDVYTSAKTTDEVAGDSLASIRLQRILGICRAILENPAYCTLGFTPPFIARVFVADINIAEPAKQDAVSVMMGRLTFTVRVPEGINELEPSLIGGYDTQVKLGLTEKGYIFNGDNIPVPEGYGGNVTVNDVFFGIVEEGDTLNVVVVDTDGNPVGEKIGSAWVVPTGGSCDPAIAVLKDSSNVTISTTEIASGDSEDIAAPDGVVSNSDASYSLNVKSNGTAALPDTTYNVYVDSVLQSSTTSPTLKNETINIIWT